MASTLRFTSADLEKMPDDGKRYEIIDGELYASKQPHYYHQLVCSNSVAIFKAWQDKTKLGQVNLAPGLIFAEDDDVAPDLVWTSNDRLAMVLSPDGKLHAAPELVIEVLSPGSANEQRDRDVKLKLYSRRAVREYWIMDWRTRQIEVYRREQAELRMVGTLISGDLLTSPLLPGFACKIDDFFEDIPSEV